MAYSRTHYGTGYYIYQQFVPGSSAVAAHPAWNGETDPPPDVLELIGRAGQRPRAPGRHRRACKQASGKLDVPPPAPVDRCGTRRRAGACCARWTSVFRANRRRVRRARLRITWDGRADPPSMRRSRSSSAPARSTTATTANTWSRLSLVIRYDAERVYPELLLPHAVLPLGARSSSPGPTDVRQCRASKWQVRYAPYRGPADAVGYFHATYRDHPQPAPGKDLVLLDTPRPKAAATGRDTSSAPASSSRTMRC